MIDDRIRAAAVEFKRQISGPVPEFDAQRQAPLARTAAVALVGGAALVGLWAFTTHQGTPTDLEQAQGTSVTTAASPAVSSTPGPIVTNTSVNEPPTTPPSPTTTTAPVAPTPGFERVTDDELYEFSGHYTIDYQPATVVLGSTGSVTYTLEMTESSFCIRDGDGSGCTYTDDGTPLRGEPQGIWGGGGQSLGIWRKYFIVPHDLTLQVYDAHGPACVMHRFPLDRYGDVDVWACENTGEMPTLIDLAVTKNDRTLIATIRRPRATNLPTSDPVTTTGYRIGDTAPAGGIAEPLPFLLVVDHTGTVVGYVRQSELDNPTFDGIVLVYNETGARIGQLGTDWRLLTAATTSILNYSWSN